MSTGNKPQFSWFPDNGNCPDVFNSIEDAIADAQSRYDKGDYPYEDGDEYTSHIIGVGSVRYFDFKNAVETIAESIEDNIYEQMSDFASGCDFECECYVSKEEKEAFINEAVTALLPIVEKYVFVNPEWVCTPTGKYDLEKRTWVEPESN